MFRGLGASPQFCICGVVNSGTSTSSQACNSPGDFGIYTSVIFNQNWISEVLAGQVSPTAGSVPTTTTIRTTTTRTTTTTAGATTTTTAGATTTTTAAAGATTTTTAGAGATTTTTTLPGATFSTVRSTTSRPQTTRPSSAIQLQFGLLLILLALFFIK